MVPCAPAMAYSSMVTSHSIIHVHIQEVSLREVSLVFMTWPLNGCTKLGFCFFLKLSILPVALRDLKLSSQRPLQELLSSSVSPC